MRDMATTLLDLFGLLAISAGIAGGLWPFVGAWALCVAGVLLLVGSGLASRGVTPRKGDQA